MGSAGIRFHFIGDSFPTNMEAEFKGAIIAAAQEFADKFSNPVTINLEINWAPISGDTLAKTAWNLVTVPYSEAKQFMPDLPAKGPTGSLTITTAEAKALGLRNPRSPALDAQITFNSTYHWAFSRADLTPNLVTYDLTGTAEHEISEAMGPQRMGGCQYKHHSSIHLFQVIELFTARSFSVHGSQPAGPGDESESVFFS
jgi:hypothetical protein